MRSFIDLIKGTFVAVLLLGGIAAMSILSVVIPIIICIVVAVFIVVQESKDATKKGSH